MSDGPNPLDDRILALTEDMPEEQQQTIRVPLTFIREAWRGTEFPDDIDGALEAIEQYAAEIRRQLDGFGQE